MATPTIRIGTRRAQARWGGVERSVPAWHRRTPEALPRSGRPISPATSRTPKGYERRCQRLLLTSNTPPNARAAAVRTNALVFGAPRAGAGVRVGHVVKQQSLGSHSHLFTLHPRELLEGHSAQHGHSAQQVARSVPGGHVAAGEPTQATLQVAGSSTAQKVQPTVLVLNRDV